MALQDLRRYAPWIIALVILGLLALIWANRHALTGRWLGEAPQDELLDEEALLHEEDIPGFNSGRAPFGVRVREVPIPYQVMLISALPGEAVPLVVEDPRTPDVRPGTFRAEATGGVLEEGAAGRWTWTAPLEPGLYPIRVEGRGGAVTLQAFVKRPFARGQEVLNGYRIGTYAAEPLRGNPIYTFPQGFIEVTPELLDTPVSPHFTVGQFLAKQASGYPKYLLLDERLLIKLELLLEETNRQGIQTAGFHVMSAFRTPHYNRAIGNTTTYSAHLYGIAADIFVDEAGDNYMDDLNGDGRVDIQDARILYEMAEGIQHEYAYDGLVGGVGIYSSGSGHGPFIHVDVRGESVRWGP